MSNKKKIFTSSNRNVIKHFWSDFVSVYKFDIFVAFILLIIVAATASIYPYLIQLVFDSLLDSSKKEWVTIPIVIACIAMIRGIAMFFQIKQDAKISLSVAVDIRLDSLRYNTIIY